MSFRLRRRRKQRRSFMPSVDKIVKAVLEEIRQATTQVSTVVRNQETIIAQNDKVADLLQKINRTLEKREQ